MGVTVRSVLKKWERLFMKLWPYTNLTQLSQIGLRAIDVLLFARPRKFKCIPFQAEVENLAARYPINLNRLVNLREAQ